MSSTRRRNSSIASRLMACSSSVASGSVMRVASVSAMCRTSRSARLRPDTAITAKIKLSTSASALAEATASSVSRVLAHPGMLLSIPPRLGAALGLAGPHLLRFSTPIGLRIMPLAGADLSSRYSDGGRCDSRAGFPSEASSAPPVGRCTPVANPRRHLRLGALFTTFARALTPKFFSSRLSPVTRRNGAGCASMPSGIPSLHSLPRHLMQLEAAA